MTWLTTASPMSIPTNHGDLPGFALTAGAKLYRIFRHQPDGDWDPPPPHLRKGRVDPPASEQGAFGVLYTADSIVTAGFEAEIIRPIKDAGGINAIEVVPELVDPATGRPIKQPPMEAAHSTTQPLVFVDIESTELSAVTNIQIGAPVPRVANWRRLSHWVHEELIAKNDGNGLLPLVGVTWISTVKDCTGRNFALYDDRRDAFLARGGPPANRKPLDVAELQRLWRSA